MGWVGWRRGGIDDQGVGWVKGIGENRICNLRKNVLAGEGMVWGEGEKGKGWGWGGV